MIMRSLFLFCQLSTALIAQSDTDIRLTEEWLERQGQHASQWMETKAIIFDCDGTLIDNGIGYFLDWQYALRCQGYELSVDEFWDFIVKNMLVGYPDADEIIAQHYCELVGRECDKEILKDKAAFSEKLHIEYEFPVIEPTVAFLRALGQSKEALGLKIGLASGNTKENILRVLRRLEVEHYFDVILSSEDLSEYDDPQGTNKPKPYIYQKAAKLLGLHPRQCVALEDSITGVSAAVSAGCMTVAIPNVYTAKQDLSRAHLKVISLENTTPPDFLQTIADYKLSSLHGQSFK